MLRALEKAKKPVLIVANKTDKIKKSRAGVRIREIKALFGNHKVIPYSSEKKIGQKELADEIFG
jgi:GTP-binding protein EngB required for normal cell division